MSAAGGKGPHAGDPVATLAFDRLDLWTGTPGEHRARVVAEDRLGHRQVEIGRRHGTAAGLAEAPGGRGVVLGDGFDHMEEGDGIGLDAVGRARQQQPEQPRLMQLVEQGRRQPAGLLDLVRGSCDRRADGLGAQDHAPVARKLSRSRGHRVQAVLVEAGAMPGKLPVRRDERKRGRFGIPVQVSHGNVGAKPVRDHVPANFIPSAVDQRSACRN